MKMPTRDQIIELWLHKYHGVTVAELLEKHPEEVKSSDWFKLFPCTQEQCDDWEREAKNMFQKKYKVSKRMIERGWPFVFLDCAPYVAE